MNIFRRKFNFSFFKDRYIQGALLLNLILFLIIFGIAYFYLRDIEHLLIIHFTNPGWIDFSGTKTQVYGIILSGLIVVFLNFFLAAVFYQRIRFFSYLFSFFSVFLSVLILIAVGVIISVN